MSIGSILITSTLIGLLGYTVVHYDMKYKGYDLNRHEYQISILLGCVAAFLTAGTALTLNANISSIVD